MKIAGQKPLLGTPLIKNHRLSSGLVFAALLNERFGDTFLDTSSRIIGSRNSATWGKGPYGACLELDGSSYAYSNVRSTGIPLTILIGVRADVLDAYGTAIGFGTNGTVNNSYSIQMQNNGRWRLITFNNAGSNFSCYESSATTAAGEWVTVAGVWRSTTEQSLFVNGVEHSDTDDLGVINPGSYIRFGAYPWAGGNFYGAISHIYIYNRALTALEISYLQLFPFCMFGPKYPKIADAVIPPEAESVFCSMTTDLWFIKHNQGLFTKI